MHNTPFSNSIEVGTESIQRIEIVLNNMIDSLTLLELLIYSAKPILAKMEKCIKDGVAIATGIAEIYTRENGLPFRETHNKIGATINKAILDKVSPYEKIFNLTKKMNKNNNLIFGAHINEYGGGPGKKVTKKSYNRAKHRIQKDIHWIKLIENQWENAKNALQ